MSSFVPEKNSLQFWTENKQQEVGRWQMERKSVDYQWMQKISSTDPNRRHG